MKFSTIELFKLNFICLNQIKSVSNHKCLDWESSSISVNQGFLATLDNPRATERVPCSERSSPSLSGKALNIVALLLDVISLPVISCLCLMELPMEEFYTYLQCSFPFSMGPPSLEWLHWSRLSVEPIILVTFSIVATNIFLLKAVNIHIILSSYGVHWEGSAGRVMANSMVKS